MITLSLEAETSNCLMFVICWRLIIQSRAVFKQRPHIYTSDMNKKSQDKPKRLFSKILSQIERKNEASDSNTISNPDQKGLSYYSNTTRKPPSGFGIAPIKRVLTAMFSLVRIRPMFEQEAPKWPWDFFNDSDSNTIKVGPKGVKIWFEYDQEAP